METGDFIIARWVLTFGVPLAWAIFELWQHGWLGRPARAAAV